MNPRPILRLVLLALIGGAVVLALVAFLLLALAVLLAAMDDLVGSAVLRYIALGCGVLWVVDLVCLVLVQGIHAISHDDPSEGPD